MMSIAAPDGRCREFRLNCVLIRQPAFRHPKRLWRDARTYSAPFGRNALSPGDCRRHATWYIPESITLAVSAGTCAGRCYLIIRKKNPLRLGDGRFVRSAVYTIQLLTLNGVCSLLCRG
ncbi:hypothetical protein KCP69_05170 [Salmonella enterica subsp. enterica]|nr:hypothetical protein KCP69_05170 [Salmonella enterica subsp. enterica]